MFLSFFDDFPLYITTLMTDIILSYMCSVKSLYALVYVMYVKKPSWAVHSRVKNNQSNKILWDNIKSHTSVGRFLAFISIGFTISRKLGPAITIWFNQNDVAEQKLSTKSDSCGGNKAACKTKKAVS